MAVSLTPLLVLRRRSFAGRLAVWFGAMFVASIVGVIVIWYAGLPWAGLPGARNAAIATASTLLKLESERHIERITTLLREKRGDILVASESRRLTELLVRGHGDLGGDFERIYARLQRAYPDNYEALMIADREGIVRAASVPGLVGNSLPYRELMQVALQPGVSETVEQIDWNGQPFIAICRQMHAPATSVASQAPDARPVGVLIAILTMTPFFDGGSDSKRDDVAMALFDTSGKPLKDGNSAQSPFRRDPKIAPGFEGVIMQAASDDSPQLAAYRHVQLNAAQGWTLAQHVPLDTVLRPLRTTMVSVGTAAALLVLLGVWLIFAAARRITQPLQDLAEVAQRLGGGELDVRAAVSPGQTQELAQLAHSFNDMAYALAISRHTLESEVKARTAEAVAARDKLLAMLDAMPDLLFDVDREGIIHDYHTHALDLLAAPPEFFLGKRFSDVLPDDVSQVLLTALSNAERDGSCFGTEYALDLSHGRFWFDASIVCQRHNGTPTGRFVILTRDITARHNAEEEVRRLAFVDPLTGLANRRLMVDRLDQAAKAVARSGTFNAVLLLDLDHFKDLNDTLGHEVGDQLLVEASSRLQSSVREGDTVSRLGGDEFVVILRDFSNDPERAVLEIELVAEKIRSEIAQPFTLRLSDSETRVHKLTMSMGVCVFSGSEHGPEELLKRADTAMYQAKHAGRNGIRFFDLSMQTAVTARMALEEQLRTAVAREQFFLVYQPLVAPDGTLIGAEALVRWQHPARGVVAPVEFISTMEKSGLILPLGHWILRTACATLASWAKSPQHAHLVMAVNISARQISMANFVEETHDVIRGSGIKPQLLKLELTESLLVENTEDIIVKMAALRASGVRFALDDFGTGYSSLAYLKRLPLDQLKIDRSFVREILHDSNDAAIARLIIGLGNTLGIPVLAEGVETREQLAFLIELGCVAFQGYLFGKPLALGDFEAQPANTLAR